MPGKEKTRQERMTSQIHSGNRSPSPRGEGCWKGARAKRCQWCLHPRTPLQAVFANAEAMLLSEEQASLDNNAGFGGSAQSPESLTVGFGSWVTVVGLDGCMGVGEVKGEIWLYLAAFLKVNELCLNNQHGTAVSGPHSLRDGGFMDLQR